MIGPEPITITLWIDLFKGIACLHQFKKIVEQKVCVVRAAAGFRVELNAEGRNVCVGDSLAGIVVYVDKAELGKRRQSIAFYCVAVVLACDVYTAGL